MACGDRQQQIEALLTHYRGLLEKRWPQGSLTIDEIEQLVAEIQREMVSDLEQRILDEQPQPQQNQADCPTCGGKARFRLARERYLITWHGERKFTRRCYYCAACKQGVVPLDDALGLDQGVISPQLRVRIAVQAARSEFAEALATLRELTGVPVDESTVERVAVGVGNRLRAAQTTLSQQHQRGELAVPKERRPRRLYISMDGKYLPLREPWKKDGTLGKLDCHGGECKLGVVYTTEVGHDGREKIVTKAYIATLEDVNQFTPLIATVAHQQGHHLAKELVALGDGAQWIWNLVAAQFPTAVQIVDYYHACAHLKEVAKGCFGEGSAEATAWVAARCQELDRDQVAQVVAAIMAWEPKGDEERKLQREEHQYFQNNAERMRYGTFRKKGYHIGSGVVESACKHVLGRRLDQAGMYWRKENAEAIACLRAALRSTHPPDLRPFCSAVA
jgi:hypothetical protein